MPTETEQALEAARARTEEALHALAIERNQIELDARELRRRYDAAWEALGCSPPEGLDGHDTEATLADHIRDRLDAEIDRAEKAEFALTAYRSDTGEVLAPGCGCVDGNDDQLPITLWKCTHLVPPTNSRDAFKVDFDEWSFWFYDTLEKARRYDAIRNITDK